jgi:hypothetical protein
MPQENDAGYLPTHPVCWSNALRDDPFESVVRRVLVFHRTRCKAQSSQALLPALRHCTDKIPLFRMPAQSNPRSPRADSPANRRGYFEPATTTALNRRRQTQCNCIVASSDLSSRGRNSRAAGSCDKYVAAQAMCPCRRPQRSQSCLIASESPACSGRTGLIRRIFSSARDQ